MSRTYRYQQAFTLIEVLVASTILFLVIALTALSFRGAVLSSQQAERSLFVNSLIGVLTDQVQQDLLQQQQQQPLQEQLTGEGRIDQLTYQWQAEQLQFIAAIPRVIPESGERLQQKPRYKLWQIALTAHYGQYQRQYSYQLMTWVDEQ